MFKLLKILGLSVLLVAALCMFNDNLRAHMFQLPGDLISIVNKKVSPEHLVRAAGEQLNQWEAELKEMHSKICDGEREISNLNKEVALQRDDLKQNEDILKLSEEDLTQHVAGEKFFIGGIEYTWERLNEEALQRVQQCKSSRESIARIDNSIATLQQTCTKSRKSLEEKQIELKRARANLSTAKAELEINGHEQKIQAMIDQINGTVGSSGDLSALSEIQDRLNHIHDGDIYRDSQKNADSEAAWNKRLGITPDKATNRIADYFGNSEALPAPAK